MTTKEEKRELLHKQWEEQIAECESSNMSIKEWFDLIIRQLKYHAFLETVLNADETPTRVLKKNGESVNKKGQLWVIRTGAVASRKIVLYAYHESRSKKFAEELLKGYT